MKNFLEKQSQLEILLQSTSQEELYRKIIELGKTLPNFPEECKVSSALVAGCQSQMYIHTTIEEGFIFFKISSDALISAGLAALLITVYNGETPETVLKCPPTFLHNLNLHTLLSPSRSSGLASILLRMKQEALNSLILKK